MLIRKKAKRLQVKRSRLPYGEGRRCYMDPKKKWMGSGIEEFVAQEMKDPAFRMAFLEARTKRIKKALGEMIRKARESQGLSQAALSKRARTTQAVISRIATLNKPT